MNVPVSVDSVNNNLSAGKILDAALAYAEYGWTVFPLDPELKKALTWAGDEFGPERWGATRDPDGIRVRFAFGATRSINVGIGVPTGIGNGFIVVETDTKDGKDGEGELAKLIAQHGPLPVTYCVRSPTGSIHYYFRHPGPDYFVKCTANEIAPGIDVKGDRGMVLVPPTERKGGQYAEHVTAPIADLPPWLLAMVVRKITDEENQFIKHCAPPTDEPTVTADEIAKLERFVTEALEKDLAWFENRTNAQLTVWGIKRAGYGREGYRIAKLICEAFPETQPAARIDRFWHDKGANEGTASLDLFWKHCAEIGIKQTTAEIAAWREEERNNMFKELGAPAPALPTVPLPAVLPHETVAAPMMGNAHAKLAELAAPTLAEFLSLTTGIPAPSGTFPQIPEHAGRHYPEPFAKDLNAALGVVAGMIEAGSKTKKDWKAKRVLHVLAIAREVHSAVFDSLIQRAQMAGLTLPDGLLRQACFQFSSKLSQAIGGRAEDGDFVRLNNGLPDPANSDNVAVYLNLSGRKARFDRFTRSVETARGDEPFERMDQDLLDDMFVEARSSAFKFQAQKEFFKTTLGSVARRDTYDSLQAYVEGLPQWDGVERVKTWISKVCGAEANDYHALVGRTVLCGMVKRALEPGCYFRHVLLLIAEGQNEGKTYLCRLLAGERDRVAIGFKMTGSEQNMRPKLAGKWVVEWGEMAGLTRDNIEDIKTFLSETDDEFVAKWDTIAKRHPRRCVFIATSNNPQPLVDDNNHRFLPVKVGQIDTDWFKANREQLLAEAAYLIEQPGFTIDIKGDDDKLIREKQEESRVKFALEETLTDWFVNVEGPAYVLCRDLQNACKLAGHGANVRPKKFMEKLGFRNGNIGPAAKREKAWIKGGAAEAVQLISRQANPTEPVTFIEKAAPTYQFDWKGWTVTVTGPVTADDMALMSTRGFPLRLATPDRRKWHDVAVADLPKDWRVRRLVN